MWSNCSTFPNFLSSWVFLSILPFINSYYCYILSHTVYSKQKTNWLSYFCLLQWMTQLSIKSSNSGIYLLYFADLKYCYWKFFDRQNWHWFYIFERKHSSSNSTATCEWKFNKKNTQLFFNDLENVNCIP